ncbi:hypothetical protein VQL36_05665 [Chengkuizengella sp. SCS-71B]
MNEKVELEKIISIVNNPTKIMNQLRNIIHQAQEHEKILSDKDFFK